VLYSSTFKSDRSLLTLQCLCNLAIIFWKSSSFGLALIALTTAFKVLTGIFDGKAPLSRSDRTIFWLSSKTDDKNVICSSIFSACKLIDVWNKSFNPNCCRTFGLELTAKTNKCVYTIIQLVKIKNMIDKYLNVLCYFQVVY